jgi:hypothetical protein
MTVIEASSVRVQTMSDSTLRLTVDIEPRFANQAFQLFGKVGTPLALAGLNSAKAEPEPERPKGGALSQWAAMRCQDPEFCTWLHGRERTLWDESVTLDARRGAMRGPATHAAEVIRQLCEIESRAELDNDPHAAARFDQHIRGPWQAHCRATGVTA